MSEHPAGTSHTIPILSIVIPCFNAMPYIRETIFSVSEWPADKVEIVVQDGGSTDGTVEFLNTLSTRISLVSEADAGQSDALNRGIRRSRGTYIGWLNADDLYCQSMWDVMSAVPHWADQPDVIYGNYSIIYANGEIMREMKLARFDWSNFLTAKIPVWSGATLWHRSVFERYGYFDENLHFCMDIDFFLRISKGVTCEYHASELGRFRFHNASKTGNQSLGFVKEGHRVRWKHAKGNFGDQMSVLRSEIVGVVYVLTRRLWTSKLWSRIRRVHRY